MNAHQVEAEVRTHSVKFIPHHDCSICGVTVGYVIAPERETVTFVGTCDCVRREDRRPSSYQAIAHWYNLQSTEKGKAAVLLAIRGGSKRDSLGDILGKALQGDKNAG